MARGASGVGVVPTLLSAQVKSVSSAGLSGTSVRPSAPASVSRIATIAFGVFGSNMGVDGDRLEIEIVSTVSARELTSLGLSDLVAENLGSSATLLVGVMLVCSPVVVTAGEDIDLPVFESGDTLCPEIEEGSGAEPTECRPWTGHVVQTTVSILAKFGSEAGESGGG